MTVIAGASTDAAARRGRTPRAGPDALSAVDGRRPAPRDPPRVGGPPPARPGSPGAATGGCSATTASTSAPVLLVLQPAVHRQLRDGRQPAASAGPGGPVAIVALGHGAGHRHRGHRPLGRVGDGHLGGGCSPMYLGYGPWPAIVAALVGGRWSALVNGTLVAFVRHPAHRRHARRAGGRPRLGAGAGRRPAQSRSSIPPLATSATGRSSASRSSLLIAGLARGRWSVCSSAAPRSAAGVVADRRQPRRRHAVRAAGPAHAARRLRRSAALLAAIAGVLNTARLGASDPSFVGLLIELSAITAVVVGGTPLAGGRVRVSARWRARC